MYCSQEELQNAIQYLPSEIKKRAVRLADRIMVENENISEGYAISTGISLAQKWIEDHKTRRKKKVNLQKA